MTRQFLEIKHFLNGNKREYPCELLQLSARQCLLRYVVPDDVWVHNMKLPRGTVTLGYYWPKQPFLVYSWYNAKQPIGYYFSIIDQLKITETAVFYRDLIVDVLVDKRLNAKLLDMDELPSDCPRELLAYIGKATERIFGNYKQIIAQLDNDIVTFLELNN